MPRPTTRDDSSFAQYRRRVPADLVSRVQGKLVRVDLPAMKSDPAVTVTATVHSFIKFSLRTRDPVVAAARHSAANTQIEAKFDALRKAPSAIPYRELVALSGEVYRLYVEKFQDDPGDPETWAALKAFNRAVREGRLMTAPALAVGAVSDPVEAEGQFGPDLTAGVNALPISSERAGMEARFGFLADWVLEKHGKIATDDSRARLLVEVDRALTDAAWALKRNAAGDYTPDAKANRFPTIDATRPAVSLDDLFDRWKKETDPSASTLSTWRGVVRTLKESVGTDKAADIRRITPEDVVAWKDAAVARGLSAKTINDSHIAGLKTLFNFATRNRLLTENPATDVRVNTKAKAGTSMLPYTAEEVASLLKLAAKETNPARRWLPLLAASSGARVGELAQLWGSRIAEEDGFHVMKLSPAEDGGALKNEGSERTVPLHPAVIEAGFLEFVKAVGKGPLFYKRSSGDSAKKHASKGVTNHLAAWIRASGFNDPRKSPNHAFRHYFKSAAAKAGVADSVADAIQGHAGASEASRYRHVDLDMMAKAVAAVPLTVIIKAAS